MHLHLNRHKDGRDLPIERDTGVVDAASVLASDLGINCGVVTLEPTKIVTVAAAFPGQDTHTYTGTEEEIRLLLELVYYMLFIRNQNGECNKRVDICRILNGQPARFNEFQSWWLERQASDKDKELAFYFVIGAWTPAEIEIARSYRDGKIGNIADLQALVDLKNELDLTLDQVLSVSWK